MRWWKGFEKIGCYKWHLLVTQALQLKTKNFLGIILAVWSTIQKFRKAKLTLEKTKKNVRKINKNIKNGVKSRVKRRRMPKKPMEYKVQNYFKVFNCENFVLLENKSLFFSFVLLL